MLKPVKSVEFNSGLKFCGPNLYIGINRKRNPYPGFVKIRHNDLTLYVNRNYVRCIIVDGPDQVE